MEKPTRPDEAIEVTKKAPEKAPLGVTSGAKDGNNEARKNQRRLARSIAETGWWLIYNAEGIVGGAEERRSLDIHLSWDCSGNEIAPTINIDSDFISREAIAEMHREEIEK